MTHDISVRQVRDAIDMSHSMREAASLLNIPFETFKYRAIKLGIYNPNQNPKGIVDISKARKVYLKKLTTPLNEILEGKHPTYHARGGEFKKRLYNLGIKKEICEECGQGPVWNGKPLKLELEHIDGDKNNHKLDNLKILCLHCHSQTPTYRKRMSARK